MCYGVRGDQRTARAEVGLEDRSLRGLGVDLEEGNAELRGLPSLVL